MKGILCVAGRRDPAGVRVVYAEKNVSVTAGPNLRGSQLCVATKSRIDVSFVASPLLDLPRLVLTIRVHHASDHEVQPHCRPNQPLEPIELFQRTLGQHDVLRGGHEYEPLQGLPLVRS